ncbi:hypothetical protein KORDIASMS9_02081 [Kordia sp. SMS9]|uniref:hypothetical protein n=1 Tax=Kordia sp. SMS9 TaxID=2282170 RepID=UPI000E0CED44|nr:hypothetical protein [Kordia sp. SMS9]AXG69853.1 hypothetical protein KORDIASMS9_02081 [Kordia sp. SMS9]
MNLHNKKFSTTENKNGLSSTETIFHYFHEGKTITGTYKGGEIKEGFVVGKQISEDRIELLFQCITIHGDLKAGVSTGSISTAADGRLLLNFDWQWLNGDLSGGTSSYIECID